MTTIQSTITDLPEPAGALDFGPWENTAAEWNSTGIAFRTFTGSSWVVPLHDDNTLDWWIGSDGVTVSIRRIQLSTGQVKRWVDIVGNTELLSTVAVRMLTASLAEANAEIVRMSATDTYAPCSMVPTFSRAV
ncbi:hypothetical protein M1247_21945 [Mycobacterium sp. 21AC1]|uniref:hypothetical protein n=1 Tax=[Mycobacterium] appelbergii TaxID=2939269 RepID=UPI002938D63A|nr:hypothetical protein [Mycobacterium sp. 21AC1]MDV3127604.1 hypothetical protein [Mycobacterium sp. 21AC1]